MTIAPIIRASLLVSGFGLAIVLGGCAGHGQHTTDFKNKSEQRVSQIKAATQWDMAQQQFLSGDLEKALRSVEQSISLNQKVAKSHLLRGRILVEMGRLDESLESFDKAIELDEQAHEAHYYRGIVYERFNQFDRALESYTAASKADPTSSQYVIASAEMLIDQQKYEEAEALLNSNKANFQHNAGVRQTLGHIAMLKGEHARAAVLFGEAALLAPDDLSIIEDHARSLLAGGKHAEAERHLKRLLASKDYVDRRDVRYLHARALLELDRPVEAREILQSLVSAQDGNSDVHAWVELGSIALKLRDGHRLREAGQRLVALAPEREEGHVYLALWQRESGKLDEAAATLARAESLKGSTANPALLRGIVLTDLGRHGEAKKSFALAVSRDPKHAEARALLARSSAAAQGLAGVQTSDE